MKFCFHKYVDGFGGMGDGYVCVKCNHFTYITPLASFLGRVFANDGTFMHKNSFPYVVRFDRPVHQVKDLESFTHYFNMSGELVVDHIKKTNNEDHILRH